MSTMNCSADKEKITVGDHIHLLCSANDNAAFSPEKAVFKLAENQKYTLKILNLKSTLQNGFDIDFTIYSPGDYKIGDLILTDGNSEISLSGAAIKVESVIKPAPDAKPPEAFGPILPIGISIPAFYYLILIGVFLMFAVYAAYRANRAIFYRKLRENLKKHNSPLEADTQFYRSIRLAEKAGYPIDQIENAFRLYNLRAYQLPMFELTNDRITKYFRRNFPEYKDTRQNLNKVLGEFEELRKKPELLPAEKSEFVKKLHRYVSKHKGQDL